MAPVVVGRSSRMIGGSAGQTRVWPNLGGSFSEARRIGLCHNCSGYRSQRVLDFLAGLRSYSPYADLQNQRLSPIHIGKFRP